MRYLLIVKRSATLVYTALMIAMLISVKSPADEIGVSIGVNSSIYKHWYKNKAEYQKTDILNPLAITYQKDFIRFFGIHTSLQYSNRSIFEKIPVSHIDTSNQTIKYAGTVEFENTKRFLSLELSPIFFYRVNNFVFDLKSGLSGDFYLNEWINHFGDSATLRSKKINLFMLSVVSGLGLGCIFKDKFKIGIRSSVSRTLNAIYKDQPDHVEIFFLNFHNTAYFSWLL